MRLTYKYRLYPTTAQAKFLDSQLHEACDLYNCALRERIDAWKTCRKSINYYDQASQLPAMRADGCLTLVNAQCAQDVLRRLDKAFTAFFVRCGRGDRPGFPRYRSSGRYDSITFPQHPGGCRLFGNDKLCVHGAGHVKVKLHRPVEGRIKTSTIKRKADHWFVCFSVECAPRPLPSSNRAVGIDLGLTSFAVFSDGAVVKNPRHHRNAEATLRRCQRKVARRKKGSNRRREAVCRLKRAYAHVRNQRADFHHKVSRQIVNSFGLIAVEDLNMRGLAGGMLAKSVHDAGWSSFVNMLSYKAECAGRVLMKVDPRGTSQTCTCGARVPKTLADRWHDCHVCGLSVGRDQASARVILQRSGWNAPSGDNVEVIDSCVA